MTENEKFRKAKRLIESLEALRLAAKQFDVHAGEFEDCLREELKNGDVHDHGKTAVS